MSEFTARLYICLGQKSLEHVYGKTSYDSKMVCVTREPVTDTVPDVTYYSELDGQDKINAFIYHTFYPRIPDDEEWMLVFDDEDIQAEYQYYYNRIYYTKEYLFSYKILVNTNTHVSPRWTANLFENMDFMVTYPPVKLLFGKAKEIPAIIVSAGPSLDKNIMLLKGMEDKVLIIALGTTLKPLLANGIVPHLCVGLDASEKHFNHFDSDLIREHSHKISLVADPMINPRILRDWNGNLFMCDTCHTEIKNWIYGFIGHVGGLSSGYSVATSAFSLALFMGCSPIIFIGQDLALGKNGKTHASLTTYDGLPAPLGGGVSYKGYNGDTVNTIPIFVSTIRWFEESMRTVKEQSPHTRVLNCTEGGAFIEGMEQMPLREALNKLSEKTLCMDWLWDAAMIKYQSDNIDKFISEFKLQRKKVEQLSNMAYVTLKIILKNIKLMKTYGDIVDIPSYAISLIRKTESNFPWLHPWFSEMDIFLDDDKTEHSESEYEKAIMKLFRCETYLNCLISVCNTILPFLEATGDICQTKKE